MVVSGRKPGSSGYARRCHPSGGPGLHTLHIAAGQARAGLNLGVVNKAKEINKL